MTVARARAQASADDHLGDHRRGHVINKAEISLATSLRNGVGDVADELGFYGTSSRPPAEATRDNRYPPPHYLWFQFAFYDERRPHCCGYSKLLIS